MKDFKFTESADHCLWGNAALALAATMARSFAAAGWPTHLSGLHDGGKIASRVGAHLQALFKSTGAPLAPEAITV